jgi:nucleosome assembly protein 1-like 1
LLALASHKFDQLIGKSSGYIESLPPAVRRRIDGLKGVQVEHAKIESEFQMAILMLEKKVCRGQIFTVDLPRVIC